MLETTNESLNGAAKTLLVTLYPRAMESPGPDALIRIVRKGHHAHLLSSY